jgi:hypothetical protein
MEKFRKLGQATLLATTLGLSSGCEDNSDDPTIDWIASESRNIILATLLGTIFGGAIQAYRSRRKQAESSDRLFPEIIQVSLHTVSAGEQANQLHIEQVVERSLLEFLPGNEQLAKIIEESARKKLKSRERDLHPFLSDINPSIYNTLKFRLTVACKTGLTPPECNPIAVLNAQKNPKKTVVYQKFVAALTFECYSQQGSNLMVRLILVPIEEMHTVKTSNVQIKPGRAYQSLRVDTHNDMVYDYQNSKQHTFEIEIPVAIEDKQ